MINMENYIHFREGNIPLIISVPHGGTLKINQIPLRRKGILGIDRATIRLGKDLIGRVEESIWKNKKKHSLAFYVISKVHRAQIDINRPQKEAFRLGSEVASQIYSLYHLKMEGYVKKCIELYGKAILIDIHGFESSKRPRGFRDVDIVLGTNNLKSIYSDGRPKKQDWDKNIRGKIIEHMLNYNIHIAPGLPRRKEYVLKGGYITQTYGASEIEKSQTIQIEFSERIRLGFRGNMRAKVLNSLAELLVDEVLDKRNKG